MYGTYSFGLAFENVETTVVTHEPELEEKLQFLFSVIDNDLDEQKKFERLVGLGIEKSFSSTIDGVMSEKVAVLKLCGENHCLIVHLLHFKKIPTSLAKFLDHSGITVVGVGIKQSLCHLRRDYGIQCRNAVVELGDLAAAYRKCPPIVTSLCLKDLYKYLRNTFAFTLSCFDCGNLFIKSADVAFSDWGTSELSKDQIYHASMEVYAAAKFAKKIIEAI
jgi:hypothetical protein